MILLFFFFGKIQRSCIHLFKNIICTKETSGQYDDDVRNLTEKMATRRSVGSNGWTESKTTSIRMRARRQKTINK
jgi:hypothetical protein